VIRAWWKVAWQKVGKNLPVSFFVNSCVAGPKSGWGGGGRKARKLGTEADPDFQIRRGGGPVIQTMRKGGAQSPKKFFPALRASFWS